ncbi:X-Pro dipeptidyl-peptidase-like protein [Cystobacter fuscus DSM 2262]|uniref:X-Pro dipeptidyl-peptidase-like protein n=1 Tax=Cystobacter fuscus (strain ATCC 25194 / DSM 2262 / NBRC 100088 / M29) TaxID=1242864 RepID=S9P642_CYSF2|nr:CocE/NonD family hydrolase [Cystobacter fuscus]EPX58626.1 X-Pro dipeptidyl-peptidase-like protein [Cystobacter fuscus DSM 2262]
MTVASRVLSRLLELPPADTHDVIVERDLEVPMPDGVKLLADRYVPRGGDRLPTLLVRSPYGRGSFFGLQFGRLFAERGFQVLIQSVRGTFGSGGRFDPFRDERADGLATLEWMKRQDWFSGEFATLGPSYLGLVQWALARDAGPTLKAMAVHETASQFRGQTYAGGAFSLDTVLSWVHLVRTQEKAGLGGVLARLGAARKLKPLLRHLPLNEVDTLAVGERVAFYQDWLEHDAEGDPWWNPADFSGSVSEVTAPVHLIGGWYDIFLPWQVNDYAALRQAGRTPYLTIGPWTHVAPAGMAVAARESLVWLKAHLKGERHLLREAPVRVFVMGANTWRDFSEWPPPGARPQRWHLQAGRGLSPATPEASEPDRYRYDPADPTPTVGGALLTREAGPRDNHELESRPDILTYTSTPLDKDLEVIGPVRAELFVRSSLAHTDFFARLCDVDGSGKSINICDGLLRLVPGRPAPEPDGTLRVTLELWPTAHRFLAGHRLRLQVSSGAHPRYARNTGSGEPLATAKTLVAADQSVFHDPAHPSALVLPVMG